MVNTMCQAPVIFTADSLFSIPCHILSSVCKFNPGATSPKAGNPEQSSGVSTPCPACAFLTKMGV